MVVNDLNTVCVALNPLEDDTPLIVDSNRVEPLQISVQLLESVRWRRSQIVQASCCVDYRKFSLGRPRYSLELANEKVIEQVLSTPITERFDHAS